MNNISYVHQHARANTHKTLANRQVFMTFLLYAL